MPHSDGARPADPATCEIWRAFHAWWQVLEEALRVLETGRTLAFDDADSRLAVDAAISASPQAGRLSEYVATFERASGFVARWAAVDVPRVDLPPNGTGGAYLRMAVRHDARGALDRLAEFLFARLRVDGDGSGRSGDHQATP